MFNIYAGIGGDEASLFVAELTDVYGYFFKDKGFKVEILETKIAKLNGFKNIKMKISGKNVFKWLKFESGVIRVKRVPKTEKSGRRHTSTAKISVIPIVDQKKIVISENDVRIDTFRSGGKGGQHVNKTETAVRITHLKTGISVSCQDERSQNANLKIAWKKLQLKLEYR